MLFYFLNIVIFHNRPPDLNPTIYYDWSVQVDSRGNMNEN